VDLAVSATPVVALNPQQGAALPALRTGEVVEAQVLQTAGNMAKIAIGNTILEVQTQVALTPGTTVKLAVNNSPGGLRLALVGTASTAGDAAGSGSAAAAITTDTFPGGTATTGANSSAESPAVITTPTAAPQDAPVTTTANESPPADPALSTIASGSANTAGATSTNVAAATTTADAQIQPPAQAPNPVVAATAALTAAVQTSAARQGGLGPLFADASVAATIPAVPEPVRQAAERLLALPPTLDESMSADDVKQGLDRSGLFLEARLSAEVNGGSAVAGSADDLKAALVVLRNVVESWLASDLAIAPASAEAADESGGTTGQALAALAADGGAPSAQTGQSAQAAANGARAQNPASAPPPPYRGAPTTGQPASAASISADTAPRDIGKVLLNETNAALARQTLLQAASLPDQAGGSATARNDTSGPRWLFEVPFPTPQGPAVAQFEIARDGHNAPAAGSSVAWRARFSLDVEPIGPVHAQIALVGTRASVTLWAERPETSDKLRDNAPELANALRQAELDPGDVMVRAGSPPRPRDAMASGRFLDRAS
jgi:hypothetical protein